MKLLKIELHHVVQPTSILVMILKQKSSFFPPITEILDSRQFTLQSSEDKPMRTAALRAVFLNLSELIALLQTQERSFIVGRIF